MTAMPEEIRAALELAAEVKFSLPISPGFDHIVIGRREDFLSGAQAAYAIGVAQGKVEGLTVSNDYTDNQYAALIAQEENAKADLSRLLDALRDKKDDGGGV